MPPQTKREKQLSLIITTPWMLFGIGFPILSTFLLEDKLGGDIPLWATFLKFCNGLFGKSDRFGRAGLVVLSDPKEAGYENFYY